MTPGPDWPQATSYVNHKSGLVNAARVRTIALLIPPAFTLSLGLFHDLPTQFIMMSVGQQRQNHLFNFDSLNYESLMLVSVDQGKMTPIKSTFSSEESMST